MTARVRDTAVGAGRSVPGAASPAGGTQARTGGDVARRVRHLGHLLQEAGDLVLALAEDLETELAGGAVQSVMASMPSATPTELPKLISTADLARVLGVDDRTVRRMRERGELPPAVDLGSVLRWRPGDIDQWIATRTEDTP